MLVFFQLYKKIIKLKSILYKSLKRLHAIFNVNVGKGDVDGGGADVGVAKDAAEGFDVFGLEEIWKGEFKKNDRVK